MGCKVLCRLCGIEASVVHPDCVWCAGLSCIQQLKKLRAFFDERRQLLVAARDRRGVVADLLADGVQAPLELEAGHLAASHFAFSRARLRALSARSMNSGALAVPTLVARIRPSSA